MGRPELLNVSCSVSPSIICSKISCEELVSRKGAPVISFCMPVRRFVFVFTLYAHAPNLSKARGVTLVLCSWRCVGTGYWRAQIDKDCNLAATYGFAEMPEQRASIFAGLSVQKWVVTFSIPYVCAQA